MSTYAQKLRLPNWQKKRLEIMQRDNWRCVFCLDNNSQLQVHHKEYIRGHEPWEYDNDNFLTLCEACHNLWHFTGEPSDLKKHLIERHGSGTITTDAVTTLFQVHHLRAI